MICLVCREAQTESGVVSIRLERGEFKALIQNIPAQVCPVCGDSYLDEESTLHLLSKAEQFVDEGARDVVWAYV